MVHKPLYWGKFEVHLSSLLLFLKAIGRHLERGDRGRPGEIAHIEFRVAIMMMAPMIFTAFTGDELIKYFFSQTTLLLCFSR